MQQTSEQSGRSSLSEPSPTSPSFAGLLAALAAPAQTTGEFSAKPSSPGRKSASNWNDDDLADDVATISYENALKAHARYRPTDQSLTQLPDPVSFCFEEVPASVPLPAPRIAAYPAPRAVANPGREFNRLPTARFERDLKESSITIRMSKAECAQLHGRAAEAGLTVSAYLRSCTFEVESLRAMVKDTLAQLSSAQTQARPANAIPQPRRSRFGCLARLVIPWRRGPRAAAPDPLAHLGND
ncbi:MAG: hypothetical protein WAK26_06100 [Terracidiphilus sp.]